MRLFRSASDKSIGWWSFSASLFSSTSKLPVSTWPSFKRSGKCMVFSVVLMSEFSWLILSSSIRCIRAFEHSSKSFRPFRSCILCFHPSVSGESSSRLCWRWVFSFKPSINFSWRCRTLSWDVFKMFFASATWDWWDSDVSPSDRICPWRWAIVSPWNESWGASLFCPFSRKSFMSSRDEPFGFLLSASKQRICNVGVLASTVGILRAS